MANVFFVTQGQTYWFERRDGYIWAPNPLSPELREFWRKNPDAGSKSDRIFWSNVELVKTGDIIIHYAGKKNGGINAISRATTDYYPAPITEELFAIANMGIPGVGLWPPDGGRRVDCEYVELRNKMPIKNFKRDILELRLPKYRDYHVANSAFNRLGNVNQGYLYELERPLAYIFIKEAINLNLDLKDYAFITKIFSDLKSELSVKN